MTHQLMNTSMISIPQNSVWQITKVGHPPRLITIIGIWGTGVLNFWTPVAYDIKDEETGRIVQRSRKKLEELIEAGKMTREF